MWFSWVCLLIMLENDDNNLQTKFGVQITSKQSNFTITGSHQPIISQLSKLILPPGKGGRFHFFLAKMTRKDEIEGTWGNFTSWLRVFEHRGKNVWGLLQPPFSELGLTAEWSISYIERCWEKTTYESIEHSTNWSKIWTEVSHTCETSLYDRLYFSSYVSHKQPVKDNDDAVSD